MRRLTVIIIAAIALTGCWPQALPGQPRGNIILYHGLGQTAATFTATDPYAALITGLEQQGWNVIIPAYATEAEGDQMATSIRQRLDTDRTGAALVAEWTDQYRHLPRATTAGPTIILGISLGGNIATHIAATEHPDGLILHEPAYTPTILPEFAAYPDALHPPPPAAQRIYMSWSTDDERVGWHAAADAAHAAGATTTQYTTLGHTTDLTVVADILGYTATL